MSARSCVIAAIATGACWALANMGDSNSDCGSMLGAAGPEQAAKTEVFGNLPRYVSLSGIRRTKALRSNNP